MTVAILSRVSNNAVYTAVSSDIVGGKIAAQPGSKVYLTDTGAWYVVNSDYTLRTHIDPQGNQPTLDAGPAQVITRTYTTSADMSTAAAITAAPVSGKKIVATDILISTDTAMNFSIQMETSANVLAKVYLPGSGSVQISLRGYLKGDAADKKLFGKASVAGNVTITAVYFSEA